MSYITLYRKYRPQNFYDIVGQSVIIRTLKNAIKYQKIHHCYLFSGDKGVGKTTLAKILVKSINCFSFKKEDCCNECESCLIINNKKSLDIVEIDGASYNGVDEIRELKNKAQYRPTLLRYKIYIIDEVHVLSHNAFNALLKLLEDPPANIIFILITSELRKIPKTIISRTQHFHLQNISKKDIQKKLSFIINQENILIDEKALEMISFYANGSLRDALNLLDQINSFKIGTLIKIRDVEEILGVVSNEKIEKLSDYLFNKKSDEIIFFLEELFKFDCINFSLFISDLIDFFQKKMIDFFKENDDKQNLFYYLSHEQKENFFEVLFKLQQNLIHSKQKKNLIIITFLKINRFFLNDNIFKKDDYYVNLSKNKNGFNNNVEFEKNKIINEENIKEDFKDNLKKIKIKKKEKMENGFVKYLKKIFLNSDEITKDIIMKGWIKLKNFPNKDLAIAASFLYKTNLLMISHNKEMLLSCCCEKDYKRLLASSIRNKIKLILNSKKELIKEYFVILKKDWEEKLYPIYIKFKQTGNIRDLDFSNFDPIFYEQNSVLNIEQNQKIIIKLAREFFGFDKVEIVNSDEE
ncbi:DNA polymerase III subunit gamma/tau [Candidatus Phytoplasma sacchari]|nr:DNA polymerase III subunit gamma/tau [Candidatus Phytoplasma sacchari]KAB8122671.1 DNA polymerase III subunit gamma/tau [Candidatus Phytoplasma sacchari]